MIMINIHEDIDSNHNILYQKSDLCIPRNETVRPRSQFLNIHVSVSDLYISRIISNTEYYNSVLEIMRPLSFISGNT